VVSRRSPRSTPMPTHAPTMSPRLRRRLALAGTLATPAHWLPAPYRLPSGAHRLAAPPTRPVWSRRSLDGLPPISTESGLESPLAATSVASWSSLFNRTTLGGTTNGCASWN
jgi:hypothetical protein